MLPTPQIVSVVAQRLELHGADNVVVDPVLRASTGAELAGDAALVTLREALLPLATVVTPNIPEAAALSGLPVSTPAELLAAARAIAAMGPRFVVITGGHAEPSADVTDLVFEAATGTVIALSHPRVPGPDRHGTGCTFSAALAAFLARGADPLDAVASASAFVEAALRRAPEGVGRGLGPLGHLPLDQVPPIVRAPQPAAG
jgi:hydroxymethylpyrimidine/phosphomethylpyrimidine kinase